MNELRKLTAEYFAIEDKLDGKPETFAALHPKARDLELRVKEFIKKSRSREVRYLARKLQEDVSNLEIRLWKYTWMEEK